MDTNSSLSLLFSQLLLFMVLSAFFSAAETSMLSINRYRLKHQANSGSTAARYVQHMLSKPDRFIGFVMLGKTLMDTLATAVATLIGLSLLGNNDQGVAIAAICTTLVLLVFVDVLPKTVAATWPEKIAFPMSFLLRPLMKLTLPLVWAINLMVTGLLKLLRLSTSDGPETSSLSKEELRTLVHESATLLPGKRKNMLLGVLELDSVTVADIMIPRNDVFGIDIEDDIDNIIEQLRSTQHTRVPVFRSELNDVIGVMHIRHVSRLLLQTDINKAELMAHITEPVFVPDSTPLHKQLLAFQRNRRRLAFVVDEYGDVQGLVTLDDILEEIVGDFTTMLGNTSHEITPQPDGSYLIDGSAYIRELNRALGWQLPVNGPKTLNGLILEHLEAIPETQLCLKLGQHRVEIMQIADNAVRIARVTPP